MEDGGWGWTGTTLPNSPNRYVPPVAATPRPPNSASTCLENTASPSRTSAHPSATFCRYPIHLLRSSVYQCTCSLHVGCISYPACQVACHTPSARWHTIPRVPGGIPYPECRWHSIPRVPGGSKTADAVTGPTATTSAHPACRRSNCDKNQAP